jgi:hypothetical protein
MTLKKVFEVLSDNIIALCHFNSKFFCKNTTKQNNNGADRYVQLEMVATGNCTVAQTANCPGLSPRRAPFYPRPCHVGLVVENVYWDRFFFE